MLKLQTNTNIYPSKLGHYNVHYPDFNNGCLLSEATEIQAESMPFVTEDKSLKAFRISNELATAWEFDLPIVWIRL